MHAGWPAGYLNGQKSYALGYRGVTAPAMGPLPTTTGSPHKLYPFSSLAWLSAWGEAEQDRKNLGAVLSSSMRDTWASLAS